MSKTVLIILTLLLAAPNLVQININKEPPYNKLERFNPELSKLNSVDKLEKFVDHYAEQKNIDTRSPAYALILAYVVSCRFYHGFSHYSMNENWMASVGEKCFGYGLACKVDPEEIMQHDNAACSQQSLVMMEVLRRKKIDYRKVGFPHHYALEIRSGSKWFYFDPNMEPFMTLSDRDRDNWKGYNDNLKKFYDPKRHPELSYQLGTGQMATSGPTNEIPARNIAAFHKVTFFLSKFLWCLPLSILIFVCIKEWRTVSLFSTEQNASFSTVVSA
jgi:hypothetical protein